MSDATSALLRALRAACDGPADFIVDEIRSRSWSSGTFAGARHELAFRLEGEGADEAASRFVEGLDAAAYTLRGHILADIALIGDERRPGSAALRVEALTVEDA
jgi:hypothetical protein